MSLLINPFKCKFCKDGHGTDHLHHLGSVVFLHTKESGEYISGYYSGISVDGTIFFGQSIYFQNCDIRNVSIQFFSCEHEHIFMETNEEIKGVISRHYFELKLPIGQTTLNLSSSEIIKKLL